MQLSEINKFLNSPKQTVQFENNKNRTQFQNWTYPAQIPNEKHQQNM